MQPASSADAAGNSMGPSAPKGAGLDNAKQNSVELVVNDVDVIRLFVTAGQRLADIHVFPYEQQLEYWTHKLKRA